MSPVGAANVSLVSTLLVRLKQACRLPTVSGDYPCPIHKSVSWYSVDHCPYPTEGTSLEVIVRFQFSFPVPRPCQFFLFPSEARTETYLTEDFFLSLTTTFGRCTSPPTTSPYLLTPTTSLPPPPPPPPSHPHYLLPTTSPLLPPPTTSPQPPPLSSLTLEGTETRRTSLETRDYDKRHESTS